MGFLRVKSVKAYQYVYWCKRVRSCKRHGGSGKVKSPDLLLGDDIVRGKYLPFYLYTGDVPLREYARAAIAYILENNWIMAFAGVKLKTGDILTAEIDWRSAPKVCLRSIDKRFDCRRRSCRQIRQDLQKYLEAILKRSKSVQNDVEAAAFCLAKYEFWTKEAQTNRDELQEYRKTPDKTWTEWESERDSDTGQWRQREVIYSWKKDVDIVLDEIITDCDKEASWFWDKYQESLNQIIGYYAPRQQQETFRHTVVSLIEKLVKDDQWFERYEWQLRSAR